jgi:hypothetical protein
LRIIPFPQAYPRPHLPRGRFPTRSPFSITLFSPPSHKYIRTSDSRLWVFTIENLAGGSTALILGLIACFFGCSAIWVLSLIHLSIRHLSTQLSAYRFDHHWSSVCFLFSLSFLLPSSPLIIKTKNAFSCHPESLAPPRDLLPTPLLLSPIHRHNPPAQLHLGNGRLHLATIDRQTPQFSQQRRRPKGKQSDRGLQHHKQLHPLVLLLLYSVEAPAVVQPCHNQGKWECWQ